MRLLDLFCGGGGAAVGYHRAGFDEIVGVDIEAQPDYPFEIVRGDALEYLAAHGSEFDAIHASPPCQSFTWAAKRAEREWGYVFPDLLTPALPLLREGNTPYVIENVPEAKRAGMRNDVLLCGNEFGLRLIRHRIFEIGGWPIPRQPEHVSHHHWRGGMKVGYAADFVTVAGRRGKDKGGGWQARQEAMGIDWITVEKQLREAIPPVYTEWIGKHLLSGLREQIA